MHKCVNNNYVRGSDRCLAVSNHKDRAGSCCSLAVSLWVADRLVVIGLVEGVQGGVDQVDHQHRIHLTKELTYLDEFTYTQKHKKKKKQSIKAV